MREKLYWNNQESKDFLAKGYLLEGETTEMAIERIGNRVEHYHGSRRPGIGERVKHHIELGNFSLSSPVFANFGVDSTVRKGLPISCFGNRVGDSIPDIKDSLDEAIMESYLGGGTSTYWGKVRGRGSSITGGSVSEGSFSFLPMFEEAIKTISQGGVRRGHMAFYQDISHPDVEEWLDIQSEGNPIQVMTYGICVSDEWLEKMKAGDDHKRELWAKVLDSREKRGLPYLFFTDNVNKNKPEVYKIKQRHIEASNLCTEIMLPYADDESFVCCLSSMNLENYDNWKDTDAVEAIVYLLDAVISEYIEKASQFADLYKTVNFSHRHRAIGIGALGWHSYLQKKSIPFDDIQSVFLTGDIFKDIQAQATKVSQDMVQVYGYDRPEIFDGTDIYMRHATLTAIAPTKSSSFILGQTSAGIEPFESNYFVKDLAKGKTTYKNPYLTKVLEKYEKDTPETWNSILVNFGSVQHLDFLTQHERDVFKTFSEISQMTIIQQAHVRQNHLCQGQSINLKILPSTPVREINNLYLTAHELGIKSLYYQYSINAAQAKFAKVGCSVCEA